MGNQGNMGLILTLAFSALLLLGLSSQSQRKDCPYKE